MMELITSFPLAKIVYTAVLSGVIVVFAQEIHRTWFDTRAYVTVANYFSDGKADAARAAAFGEQVLSQHHRMLFDLSKEKSLEDPLPDEAQILPLTIDTSSVGIPVPAQKLEMKIQGFDVGALLDKLRGWVSPVNEVFATVEARAYGKPEAQVVAAVSWPMASDGGASDLSAVRFFSTGVAERDDEVGAEIAANLVWAALRKESTAFKQVPRDEFVGWLLAWQRYREIRGLKLPPAQLSEANKKSLERAGDLLKPFLVRRPQFSEVWRLAANLTVQHPRSISGDPKPWESYRDAYLLAVKKPIGAPQVATTESSTGVRAAQYPVLWRGDGQIAAKVTAIVKDPDGKRYALLPAMLAKGAALPFELFGEPGQNKVAVARAVRLLKAPDSRADEAPTLMLAEILSNDTLHMPRTSGLGPAPEVNAQVIVAGSGRKGTVESVGAKLANLGNVFSKVSPQITFAGDAGVPILDANGKLVAMGYAGSGTSSWIVPIAETLQQEGFTVEP